MIGAKDINDAVLDILNSSNLRNTDDLSKSNTGIKQELPKLNIKTSYDGMRKFLIECRLELGNNITYMEMNKDVHGRELERAKELMNIGLMRRKEEYIEDLLKILEYLETTRL